MLHQRERQEHPMQACGSWQYKAGRIKLLLNEKADSEQYDIYMEHDLKIFKTKSTHSFSQGYDIIKFQSTSTNSWYFHL